MITEDILISSKDLMEWLNREITEDDEELCMYLSNAVKNQYEYHKEISRLNNIIDELEKWLEEQHQFIIEIPAYTKDISIEHKTMEICYENVLDKLNELKGDNK